LDWLTDPENMELNDHIEKVNRKMFAKIQQSSEYVAVFFCKSLVKISRPVLTNSVCRQQGLSAVSQSAGRNRAHR
jgi:hypothetical protein